MGIAPLIDIALAPRAGAYAPFAMHAADGTLIGMCETIRRAGGQFLITGWTTCAAASVRCGGGLLGAEMGEPRPQVAPSGEPARAFRAIVPPAASGFLILHGSDADEIFCWRSSDA